MEFQLGLVTQGKQNQDPPDPQFTLGQGQRVVTGMGQVGRGGQRQAGLCEYPIPQLGWKERGQGLVDLGMSVGHSH